MEYRVTPSCAAGPGSEGMHTPTEPAGRQRRSGIKVPDHGVKQSGYFVSLRQPFSIFLLIHSLFEQEQIQNGYTLKHRAPGHGEIVPSIGIGYFGASLCNIEYDTVGRAAKLILDILLHLNVGQ